MVHTAKKDKAEKDFLAKYDSSEFEKPSTTVDILLFSISDEKPDSYRRLSKKSFSVLLLKRADFPFKDTFAIPGGFVKIDESLEDAADRVLFKETNLKNIYTEQLYTFGGIHRDPRTRVISVAYMALVDKNKLKSTLAPSAKWFDITFSDNQIELKSDAQTIKFKAPKDITKEETYPKNSGLAFDHAAVLSAGIERIRNKINYTDIVFNMMPAQFTLAELQQVYEVILGKKLLAAAFRRTIAHKVSSTGILRKGAGFRPSELFTYNKENNKK